MAGVRRLGLIRAGPARRLRRRRGIRTRIVSKRQGFQGSRWNPKMSGMPDRLFVKMRYATSLVLQPGAASASHVYRGNSVNDPDFTGVGHQPMGLDQYANFWDRTYVTSCSMNVFCTSSTSKAVRVTILPQNISTVSADQNSLAERPRSRTGLISNSDGVLHLFTSNTTKAITGERYTDDMTALIGANVNVPWFYIISAHAVDQSSASVVDISVELLYTTQFFHKKPLTGS